jgi:hypothetical protein
MNINLNHRDIRRLLDRSADQLDRPVLNGLQAAREHALQRQRTSISTRLSPDGMLHGHLQPSQRTLGWIVAAIVATLLLVNMAYQYRASEHDRCDIDIAILTDELPIDMYVD